MVTVGIDEAGQGCWAGPLVAAAVILPQPIDGLNDSKKLSSEQRAVLAEIIEKQAIFGLGWITPAEIDRLGLTESVRRAMSQALAAIEVSYDQIIIDGNFNFLADNPKARPLIGADGSLAEASAASILAKVQRDRYMATLGDKYTGYGFEKHVGYGTAQHIAALKLHGVSDIHRLSYKPIKRVLQELAQ